MGKAKTLIANSQDKSIALTVQRKVLCFQMSYDRKFDKISAQRQVTDLLTDARTAGMVVEECELRLLQFKINPLEERRKSQIEGFVQEAMHRKLRLLAQKAHQLLDQEVSP